MNKTRNRALSLLLTMIMTFSLMAPAFALGGQVNVKFADGSTTTLANASNIVLYKGGVKNVESVTVSTGADESLDSDTYTDFSSTITDTLPLGTKYEIYTVRDNSGDETLNFRYTNELNDIINIEVVGQAVTYNVYAGSGVYGQNNNQGGLSTCTISAENATTNLPDGAPYTVTFTPVSGQEITKLNLRIGSADGTGRIVDPVTGKVSIGSQDLQVTANANGSVTVAADSVIRDLYLVALTKDAASRYDFNIRTDGNCTADVTSSSMVAGSTKTVTFTPTSGFTVTDITITEGSASKTITLVDEKVEINKKIYSVERKLDGAAVLSVPAMSDNVFISAVAQDNVHYVKVNNSNRSINTNKAGMNAVNGNETLEVIFAPTRDYTEIRSLTITTPATGTRTYTLDGRVIADSTGFNGYYFDAATGKWFNGFSWEDIGDNWVIGRDGRYYNTDTGRWYDYPYLDGVRTVWVRGTDGRYYNTETGKWYDSPYFNNTTSSNWTYDDYVKYGTLYRDDPYWYNNYNYGSTWGVNGTTWTVNGATVRLYYDARDFLHVLVSGMTENMEFTANSHDSIHTVNVSADKGVEIEKKSYEVDDGDDMEITFTPAKDTYAVRTLYITYGTQTYKAAVEDDTYVRVDGTRWNISVDDDGVVTLDMADITEDVVVRAESNYTVLRNLTISRNPDSRSNITYTGRAPFDSEDKVTLRVYTSRDGYILDKVTFKLDSKSVDIEPFDTKLTLGGMTYTVKWIDNTEFSIEFAPLPGSISVSSKTVKGDVEEAPEVPDENDNKTDPPTSTDPIVTPPTVTSVTHNAYMKGVGGGKFAPDKSLTRAEAVTLLNRAILGMDDSATSSYASSAYFTDVPASFWGAGAINYAGSQGYLSVLNTSSNFSPNNPITRAEFLALLCKYRNVDVSSASTTTSYVDVPSSHWAVQYISYATSQGWVQGVGSSQFTPDSAVTRAAICTMVNHILGRAADSNRTAATGATFSDVPLTYWGYADIFEATFTHQATVNNGVETWM